VQFNYNIKLQEPTQTKRKVEIQVTHPLSPLSGEPLRKNTCILSCSELG